MTISAPLASLVDRLAAWAAPLLPESGSLPPRVSAACDMQRLAARIGELVDGTASPLTRLRGVDVAIARLGEALPAVAPDPDLAADSVIDATEARHAEGLYHRHPAHCPPSGVAAIAVVPPIFPESTWPGMPQQWPPGVPHRCPCVAPSAMRTRPGRGPNHRDQTLPSRGLRAASTPPTRASAILRSIHRLQRESE